MKSLSFKTKILLFAIIPMVTVTTLITLMNFYQAWQIGKKNITSFSNEMIDFRRNELKNYTEIAESAVKHIYTNQDLSRAEAHQQAKEVLRNLAYGNDGYFFVSDYDALTLVNRVKPSLEGRNLRDVKDPQGVYVVQELLKQAKAGGGYVNYQWDKPTKGRVVEKISYAQPLELWQWMFGTGLYIDDIQETVDGIKQEVTSNIKDTLTLVTILAVLATVVVGFVGARFTMSEGKLADEKLQKLSRKVVEGQEAERGRVAHDLQRNINKSLYAARDHLKSFASTDHTLNGDIARQDFFSAITILNKTIKEVYRISGELRPAILDRLGLYSAVEALSKEATEESGIQFSFKKSDSKKDLNGELETAIYRIVQEAVNNIIAHSEATSANIRIRHDKSTVNVTIHDNGVGFDTKTMWEKGGKANIGFTDMEVRAESLGGSFNAYSSKKMGTVIKVDIPI